jgi:alkanesulfonate monooxygenase SsuD/methylene tetrahydromethanopterin reductase-like flavin-dependent oxidoreductase (luciferase family)
VESDVKIPVRVGVVILPEYPWREAVALWRRAEQLGFSHAWTYDHLTWRGHRDRAWFGAVPTLTAAALATDRIRLGTLVASPNFRHPLPLAKEVVTLDDICCGRFTLGIGSGSTGWDATMTGTDAWTLRERSDRFSEFVEVADLLLRDPTATYVGRFYSARDARTLPGCVQRPRVPFAIAASAPKGIRVAARFAQTWVTTGSRVRPGPVNPRQGARDVRQQMDLLDRACNDIGRESSDIARMVVTGPTLTSGLRSRDEFADTAGCYASVGVTDLAVHWPRPTEPYQADYSIFERIFSG